MKQDVPPLDLTNEGRLAKILKDSGKPWILDVMEAMEMTGMQPDQLLQSLFLLANIKRFTKWGQIIWLVQNGKLTQVVQEQRTKFD